MKQIKPLNAMEWAFLLSLTLAFALLVGLWWVGIWPLDRFYRPH